MHGHRARCQCRVSTVPCSIEVASKLPRPEREAVVVHEVVSPSHNKGRPILPASAYQSDLSMVRGRVFALVAAVAVNLLGVSALMMPSPGQPDRQQPTLQPLLLAFSDATPQVRQAAPNEFASSLKRIRFPLQHAMLTFPIPTGPPTESRTALAGKLDPDRDAAVVEAGELQATCHQAYPGAFTSEPALKGKITL